MGNSKQKIIEKLNCIPDDLSEEEIIERLYRMMRLEQSKQRCEKEGSFTDEQVTAHFADKLSALDRGIEDMEAGSNGKSNGVKKQVILTNNKFQDLCQVHL